MMAATQSPAEEAAERSAQVIPGLAAAAAAVGLEDHRRTLYRYQQRVEDSHRSMADAAGFAIDREVSDEDMGDIVITGDIQVGSSNQVASVLDAIRNRETSSMQPAPTATPSPTSGLSKTLATVALTSLGLGAGAALPIAAWNLTRADTTIISGKDTATDVSPGFGVPEFISPTTQSNQ